MIKGKAIWWLPDPSTPSTLLRCAPQATPDIGPNLFPGKLHKDYSVDLFKCCEKITGLFEFFMIRISVRLPDRSKVTQIKINFVKNCTQWGLNSQPPNHQSRALPTVLGRNLLEISEVSFLSCTTSHVGCCLFLESIKHAFIKALMIHTDNQIVT